MNYLTFLDMSELKYLRLASNKISYLHQKTFVILPELELLDLSDNAIQGVESGAFFLVNLQHLILNFNDIHNVGTFPQEIQSLRNLHLRGNKIKEFNLTTIHHFESIDLSLNQISHFDTPLVRFPRIRFVNLTHNKLHKLSLEKLQEWPGIQVRPKVYLEGNFLHCDCNIVYLQIINTGR